MRDYVSGISVPDEIVTRLEDASNAKEEGVRIILEVVERAGLLPRPVL